MVSSRPFSRDVFLAELKRLGSDWEREVVVHRRIDSTSSDLKRRLKTGAQPGTVVAADFQEEGRGRQGRTWHSPKGGNLYVSLAVLVDAPVYTILPLLPLAAGVAARDAVRALAPIEPKLKWPNDLLVSNRKLAGILCEAHDPTRQPVVAMVGLGINIDTTEFPKELGETATSMALLHKSPPESALVAAHWVVGFEQWKNQIQKGRVPYLINAWRQGALPFGRRVCVGDIEGVTVDLTDNGRLIVLKDNGETVAVAGGIVAFIDR